MNRTLPTPWKPTNAQVLAARNKLVPDLIAKNLIVLFAGINPGLYSTATGRHFARPGNRFWPALHRSGFTPRQFRPDEQDLLLGLGLGALLRSTAGGISALFGLLFAVQIAAGFLPGDWADNVGKYLPGTAGLAVTAVRPDPVSSLPPWTGFGVFCLYAAVLLGLAAARMRRGDA